MEDARIPGDERSSNRPSTMKGSEAFPAFDEYLPDLNDFVLELVGAYQSGDIRSWDELDTRVKAYFTPQRMEQVDAAVPGWQRMASFADGITLVHVMCVFLGLFILPEFQSLHREQQQLAKWIVLFHDVEKQVRKGGRDAVHGFRSAVVAAKELPNLGFPATAEYARLINPWSELAYTATKLSEGSAEPIQDNDNLPEILAGIDTMFGADTPAALIVKCVLLHMSINVVRDWPQAAPLTDEEIKRYVVAGLAPLLKCMMLADNEGWSLFDPGTRALQREETLEAFREVDRLLS